LSLTDTLASSGSSVICSYILSALIGVGWVTFSGRSKVPPIQVFIEELINSRAFCFSILFPGCPEVIVTSESPRKRLASLTGIKVSL